jgi:hypothetical protein
MFGKFKKETRINMNKKLTYLLILVPYCSHCQDTLKISFAGYGGSTRESYIVIIANRQYNWEIGANGGTLRRLDYVTDDSLYIGRIIPITIYKKRLIRFLGYRRIEFVSLSYFGPSIHHIIYRHWRFKARYPLMEIYTTDPFQLDIVRDRKFWFEKEIPMKQYLEPKAGQ